MRLEPAILEIGLGTNHKKRQILRYYKKTSEVKQPDNSNMKRVLFVCIENSCRSQIAEAFAHFYGKDKIEPFSAGSQPSGKVNPKAIKSMKELGYDLTGHSSKSLTEIPPGPYEYVITMGCGDVCPFIPAKSYEDWGIPDPKELSLDEFRKIRTLIENKARELIAKV